MTILALIIVGYVAITMAVAYVIFSPLKFATELNGPIKRQFQMSDILAFFVPLQLGLAWILCNDRWDTL